jgi:DNA primase
MVKECDYIVLVEGYTDVIQLQKYNIPTVGLMGTALSKEQIEKIKKCTNNIILFFDGDEPGQKSAKAHAKTLKEHRFNVKSVLTDKDPDEIAIIHKDGIANFIEENAISIPGYEINLLLADGARKIDDIIISSLRKIIPLLVDIPDSIELEYYIEKVSVALGIKKPDLYRMIAEGGYYGSVN